MNSHYNKQYFQGRNKSYKSNYFEGWYYKQTSVDGVSISFIPGVSMNTEDPHAFVQCLYNNEQGNLEAHYFRYSMEDFGYFDDPFEIVIGDNRFSETGCHISLEQFNIKIEGIILFKDLDRINHNLFCPNIMGVFSYIPNMECNHDIISMKHGLEGSITYKDESIDFHLGKGYIEKDWGTSFPKEYIWLQCNEFTEDRVRFMCSVATIPFGPFNFTGFFAVLRINGGEYRFATYNGAQIERIITESGRVGLILKSRRYRMSIIGHVKAVKALPSPLNGVMDQRIKEGLGGVIQLHLIDKKGNTIYKGQGNHAGIEIEMNRKK